MSKVKFIQIGSETLQYNDITPEGEDKIEGYKSKLDRTLNDYPGAIIFGTYTEGGEKKQEIWANGTSYSVGGGGGGTVYVGTYQVTSEGKLPETTTGHNAANNLYFFKDEWSTTTDTSGKTIIDTTKCVAIGDKFKEGDIYVEKRNTEAKALESSGYVYSKGRWEALAGSVNAENVWLAGGQQATQKWCEGNSSDEAPVDIMGKSAEDLKTSGGYTLKDMLDYVLIKNIAGTVTASEASLAPQEFTITDLKVGNAAAGSVSVQTTSGTDITQYALVNTSVNVYGSYDPSVRIIKGGTAEFTTTNKSVTNTYKLKLITTNDEGDSVTSEVAGKTYSWGQRTLKKDADSASTKGERSSKLTKSLSSTTAGTSYLSNQTGKSSSAILAQGADDQTMRTYGVSVIELGTQYFWVANSNGNSWGRDIKLKTVNAAGAEEWTTLDVNSTVIVPKLDGTLMYSNNKEDDWNNVSTYQNPSTKQYPAKSVVENDKTFTINATFWPRTATCNAHNYNKSIIGYYPIWTGALAETQYAVNTRSETSWVDYFKTLTQESKNSLSESKYTGTKRVQCHMVASGAAFGPAGGSVFCIVPSDWELQNMTTYLNGKTPTTQKDVIDVSGVKKYKLISWAVDGANTKLNYTAYACTNASAGWADLGRFIIFNFN